MHKLRFATWNSLAACLLMIVRMNAAEAATNTLVVGQWYKATQSTPVVVLHSLSPQEVGMAREGEVTTFPAGLEFMIEEYAQDAKLGWMAHIWVDTDEESGIPADFRLSADELLRTHPEFSEMDTIDIEKRMTYCYRDVITRALKMGLCPSYPGGSEAWMGYTIMQRTCGMRPISYTRSLPIGAVCFSEGRRYCSKKRKCGHVMIKVSKSKWFGAGYRSNPLIGKSKGCIAKPKRSLI